MRSSTRSITACSDPAPSNAALCRLRQVVLALGAGFGAEPALPQEIDRLLTETQRTAWRELPTIERAHLARVGRIIVDEGHVDADLLIASIFHDIGKYDGRTPVRLPHRVARVLAERWTPSLLDGLRAMPRPPRVLRPLWLCVHHPRLGADRARAIGCSERSCWLIAHHEDPPPVGNPQLAALQRADDRA